MVEILQSNYFSFQRDIVFHVLRELAKLELLGLIIDSDSSVLLVLYTPLLASPNP